MRSNEKEMRCSERDGAGPEEETFYSCQTLTAGLLAVSSIDWLDRSACQQISGHKRYWNNRDHA